MEREANVLTIRANDGAIIKFESHIALESTADIARKYAAEGYPDILILLRTILQK